MSIMNGDGKGHLLISYSFPEGSSMAQQCALERELTLAVAKAAEEVLKDNPFYIINGDEMTVTGKEN